MSSDPKIRIEEEIDAPVDAVWQRLSDFGGLGEWAGVNVTKVEGSGVGAIRSIAMGDNIIRERLEAQDDAAHSFSYSIVDGPIPVENYLVKVSVAAGAKQRAKVLWTADFDAPGMNDEQAGGLAKGIEGTYRGLIEALRKTLGA